MRALQVPSSERVLHEASPAVHALPAAACIAARGPKPWVAVPIGGGCQRGSSCGQGCVVSSRQQPLHTRPLQPLQALWFAPAQVQQQQETGAAAGIQDATAEQVLARVADHTKAADPTQHLMVMFSAEWCGPCSLLKRELLKLEALRPAGTLSVLVVDVGKDENKAMANELAIGSLPTLVFVGHDPTKPSICTLGHVSSRLVADVLDNKMSVCGADLSRRLRLA